MITKKQITEAGYVVLPKGAWYRLDPNIDPIAWEELSESLGFDPSCKEVIFCISGFKEIKEEVTE